jgi:hypothetical protein
MITLDRPQLKINPVPDFSFPVSLIGKTERLPYRTYVDDFDSPIYCQYLIVTRDIPEYGFMVAQSLESHYKELFSLGYSDSEDED